MGHKGAEEDSVRHADRRHVGLETGGRIGLQIANGECKLTDAAEEPPQRSGDRLCDEPGGVSSDPWKPSDSRTPVSPFQQKFPGNIPELRRW